jgi:hypothetical protein
VQRAKQSALKFTEKTQVELNAGKEGWLAPAQSALLSTLNGRDIERGQATLPDCIYLSLNYFSELED